MMQFHNDATYARNVLDTPYLALFVPRSRAIFLPKRFGSHWEWLGPQWTPRRMPARHHQDDIKTIFRIGNLQGTKPSELWLAVNLGGGVPPRNQQVDFGNVDALWSLRTLQQLLRLLSQTFSGGLLVCDSANHRVQVGLNLWRVQNKPIAAILRNPCSILLMWHQVLKNVLN